MLHMPARSDLSGHFNVCLGSVSARILCGALLLCVSACLPGGGGSSSGVAVAVADCDGQAVRDKSGGIVLPSEASDVGTEEYVDEDLGSVAALYPGMDTTTDAFYPNRPCDGSIGGELPAEETPPSQGELASQAYLDEFDTNQGKSILNDLLANPLAPVGTFANFTLANCFIRTEGNVAGPGTNLQVPCDDPVFLNNSMPFEGRDIIYMHGLDTGDLFARISDPTGPASSLWPSNPSAFLNAGGFFRVAAEKYWLDHITEHLSSQFNGFPSSGWQWTSLDPVPIYVQKANRYLLIAWSSNQTIEYAQHAMLTQIKNAMQTGQNVVTPAGYPAGQVRPFCANGCIVIGHSTGPLITSSALGLAHIGFFGDGGRVITNHIAAHISFDGAISGSRIATIGMVVSMLAAPVAAVSNFLCPIVDAVFGTQNACNADLSFVGTSILRDLIPAVSQGVWGSAVNASPVPTVTLAGGHPLGNQAGGLTSRFLPGVDDGVVTMNSACGNPNPVFPYLLPPSGFSVTSPIKAFDFSEFGDRLTRAAGILAAQKHMMVGTPWPGPVIGPLYLAAACTPYLSATGMLMPVAQAFTGLPFDARKRYNNHYSFIQSLGEHSYDGGGHAPNEWPSKYGFPASDLREYSPVPAMTKMLEDSRAVTDGSVYTRQIDHNGTYLLKPLDMREIVRGRKITFKMPFNVGGCKKPSGATLYRCQRWVWKRTYHLADKWQQKQSSHYAYEFIGRR